MDRVQVTRLAPEADEKESFSIDLYTSRDERLLVVVDIQAYQGIPLSLPGKMSYQAYDLGSGSRG